MMPKMRMAIDYFVNYSHQGIGCVMVGGLPPFTEIRWGF